VGNWLRSLFRKILVWWRPAVTRWALTLRQKLGLASIKYADATERVTVKRLEEILQDSGGVSRFLRSRDAQERYLLALKSYYRRSDIHDLSYFKIIEQWREMHEQLPEFSRRIWREPENPFRFEIRTTCPSHGRALDPVNWRLYRNSFLESLRLAAEVRDPDTQDLSPQLAKVEAVTKELAGRLEDLERALQKEGLRKAEKINIRSLFYRKLKNNPTYRAVSAFLLYRYILDQQSAYFFDLTDGDLAIDFFRQLHQHPALVLGENNQALAPLASVVKSLVPATSLLLKQEFIFPPVRTLNAQGKALSTPNLPTSVFVSTEVAPIHGIWAGIFSNDCLGGDPKKLETLTPRRWAIGALAGAHTFMVERQEAFQGVVRIAPVRLADGTVAYNFGSVPGIFGSLIPQVGRSSKGTFAEHWADAWMQVDPRKLPFVITESRTSDADQVKKMILKVSESRIGPPVLDCKGAQPEDPRALEYLTQLPATQGVLKYGSGFILDATLDDAMKARILPPLRQ
jgi:hypothetical protein